MYPWDVGLLDTLKPSQTDHRDFFTEGDNATMIDDVVNCPAMWSQ